MAKAPENENPFGRRASEEFRDRTKNPGISGMIHGAGMSGEYVSPGEYALMTWLSEMQNVLIYAATDGFIADYRAIMNGQFCNELIHDSRAAVLMKTLKDIAYDYACADEFEGVLFLIDFYRYLGSDLHLSFFIRL